MKKKKNMSLIFAIVLIVLLILSIVGATYAYYTANARKTNISGSTATSGLDMIVTKLSTDASGNLIPLDNNKNALSSAAKGYGNNGSTFDKTKSCIDKNGYSVCQVYEITVTNNSSANAVLSGGVSSLSGDNTPNIACATMISNVEVSSNASCVGDNTIANNVTFTAGAVRKYYIIVYINNLEEAQDDYGEFNGVITFSSANGKLEASFH